jgi:hypothetical protein
MSRVATPPAAKPVTSPTSKPASPQQQFKIPPDKIAKRAYDKWAKRGYAHGRDRQDWLEAEAELLTEYGYSTGNVSSSGRR